LSKLVDQLEKAIKDGDWAGVCASFKKMTGREVQPPVVKPVKSPFNPATAKKVELYKELSSMLELEPIKSYTISDLRSMWILNSSDSVSEDAEVINTIPVRTESAYTYIPPEKAHKVLNGDKVPLRPTFRDFDTYGDEGKTKVERNRKANLMKVNCRKCKVESSVSPAVVTKSIDGDNVYICPKCS